MRKTTEEIKSLYDRYDSNADNIPNTDGKKRIQKQMEVLNEFLNNPDMNLDYEIRNSEGERRKVLRWINGEFAD